MKKFLKLSFCALMFTALTMFTGCPEDPSGGGGGGGGGGSGGGDGGGVTVINDGSTSEKAIQLTEYNWADGNIAASDAVQWFKFTATNTTHYIHINLGTLTSMKIQLYRSDGTTTVGSEVSITTSTTYKYTSQSSLTIGQFYYIKITPNSSSGTFKIVFCRTSTAPIQLPSTIITLTENLWSDGNLPTSNDEQWFQFTATAVNPVSQYIHVNLGTLTDMYVQLYDYNGNAVGSRINLYGSTKSFNRSLTNGQIYYIKVTPYGSSDKGTYQIGFTTSITAPNKIILPTDATVLIANVWTDDNSPEADEEQWFKFTATNETQYIHVSFGSLNSFYGINVQLYDSNEGYGTPVGDKKNLYSGSNNISRSLSVGKEYYIKVTLYSSSYPCKYKIAFNASATAPTTIKTPSNAILLTADIWANGSVTTDDAQWFKFNATAETQYIHASFGTMDSFYGYYIQLYDSNEGYSNPVGTQTRLYSSIKNTSMSLSVEKEYYIKVTRHSESYGTYQIAFSTSSTPPLNP